MKKLPYIISIVVIGAGLLLLFRHHSAPANVKFVREAVVQAETVERIRSLFTGAGIKVVAEKIEVPEGGFHAFPPGSYKISVPEEAQERALALIHEDAPKGQYWIQAGPILDTIDPPRTTANPATTNY